MNLKPKKQRSPQIHKKCECNYDCKSPYRPYTVFQTCCGLLVGGNTVIHTVKLKDRTSTKCPALNGLDLSISSLVLTAMKILNEYMHKAAVVDNDSLRESYPITRSPFMVKS